MCDSKYGFLRYDPSWGSLTYIHHFDPAHCCAYILIMVLSCWLVLHTTFYTCLYPIKWHIILLVWSFIPTPVLWIHQYRYGCLLLIYEFMHTYCLFMKLLCISGQPHVHAWMFCSLPPSLLLYLCTHYQPYIHAWIPCSLHLMSLFYISLVLMTMSMPEHLVLGISCHCFI